MRWLSSDATPWTSIATAMAIPTARRAGTAGLTILAAPRLNTPATPKPGAYAMRAPMVGSSTAPEPLLSALNALRKVPAHDQPRYHSHRRSSRRHCDSCVCPWCSSLGVGAADAEGVAGMVDIMDRPYSSEDLADRWGVSAQHVRDLIRSGSLRHFRVGRLIRIPAKAVYEFEECPSIASSSIEGSSMPSGQTSARHYFTRVTQTVATPALTIPILAAAALERSNCRPRMNGPLSRTTTTTDLPR